jgi:hypothetical protein
MTNSTDVHFAGSGVSVVSNTAIIDGIGDITIDNGAQMFLQDNSTIGVDVENSGRLEVGATPTEVALDLTEAGNATISGNFSQGDTGVFGIELGGLVQANEFDVLNITGTARLEGMLEVELIDGFVPDIGNMFQILTAGSVIGTFNPVNALDGGNLFDVDVSVLYSATDVVVQIDDVALLGDYNKNGTVDAADYALWRDTNGNIGKNLAADGNEDGTVDDADYGVWRAHFGNTAQLGGGAFADSPLSVTVPEPATYFLLMIAILMCVPRCSNVARRSAS